MNQTQKTRFWEIDSFRGIAIIMMIIYHTIFDLNYFNILAINLYSLPIRIFLYPIGTLFLLLVGVSLTLSYRKTQHNRTTQETEMKFLLRGLKMFSLGLLITAVTWIYPGNGFIIFGILHCIGVSIILAYPLLRYRLLNLILGVMMILGGLVLTTVSVGFPWLLWLGVAPSNFYTLDYFPLLPWFGVVLIGVFLGNILYTEEKRRFRLPDFSQKIGTKSLSFLGRHSLVIYLVHQPIIIGLLLFFHGVS